MPDGKIRILWLSDSPLLATGFARVTREITRRLATDGRFQIACLALGYHGWPYDRTEIETDLYPAAFDFHGEREFEAVIRHFQPQVVITLAEIWMIEWLVHHPLRQLFKWIAYVPLDGGPFYPAWTSFIKNADEVVAMSFFGQRILESGVPSKRVRLIYHGVDCNVFRPLENRDSLKSQYPFRGKFVIGCVARNQSRKNIPALVKAFANLRLHSKLEDFHLYLHMAAHDVGFDLPTLLDRYHLQGCADIANPDFSIHSALNDEQLCQVYNLFDVMVLTSTGEGFGLPLLESMATAVPVIAPNYSACSELVSGRGELAAIRHLVTMGQNLIEHAFVDEQDLTRCILQLRVAPDLWKRYSKAGRQFALSLDWDRIVPLWANLIEGVLSLTGAPRHSADFIKDQFFSPLEGNETKRNVPDAVAMEGT